MRLAIDTETTGRDLRHGCLPFYANIYVQDTEGPDSWEWDVDPLTRMPDITRADFIEIMERVEAADELNLQNAKFDVGALAAAAKRLKVRFRWPWEKTHDLLLSAHMIASNRPKNLTIQALEYLEIDIEPFERRLHQAVAEARRHCRSKHKNWLIAKEGLPMLPSAKSSSNRDEDNRIGNNDYWLPRTVARLDKLPKDHDWWTVLKEYADPDPTVTLHIKDVHMELLRQRNLEKIYEVRRKIPRINYMMESRGVSFSMERLKELRDEYTEGAKEAEAKCIALAGEGPCLDCIKAKEKAAKDEAAGKVTKKPKKPKPCKRCNGTGRAPLLDALSTGVSNALRYTAFNHFKLSSPFKTDSGEPALNAKAVEFWKATLDSKSKPATFIRNMSGFRSRATAISFMNSYERFGVKYIPVKITDKVTGAGWYILHPSLNPTGSNTLRWTSSNPNEQNISKKEGFNLRYCFGPLPGREWWSMDAQNIELRIPAYESGEQELIDLFERPNEPPYFGSNHMLIFHTLHPDKWNEQLRLVGPDKVAKTIKTMYASSWYQWTKNGNFAVQYGAMEESGTADAAYHIPGAQRIIQSRFTKQSALNQKCIEYAEEYGYVETIPDITVDPERGYPLLCTRTEWGRILPTVPLNYHVQGTAMWWMMKAMIRVQEYLDEVNKERGGDYCMVMQVHDELVFDFPRSQRDPTKMMSRKNLTNLFIVEECARLMKMGGNDIGLPTPVSVSYHPESWAKDVEVPLLSLGA